MIASLLVVGDRIEVRCIDGFAGYATVTETRDTTAHNRCMVHMDDNNPTAPFWAHDFELFPLPPKEWGDDSRPATIAHIAEVQNRLECVIKNLHRRQTEHDLSKLADPEKSTFDEFTPKLKASTYGGEEYKSFLAAMKPALDHHYAHNSHHPEHFVDGIAGMSLLDIIEMLADWKAATMRHADGDLGKSIEINQKRFGYTDELKALLRNTAVNLGWLTPSGVK